MYKAANANAMTTKAADKLEPRIITSGHREI
jgi:hypothetical protein